MDELAKIRIFITEIEAKLAAFSNPYHSNAKECMRRVEAGIPSVEIQKQVEAIRALNSSGMLRQLLVRFKQEELNLTTKVVKPKTITAKAAPISLPPVEVKQAVEEPEDDAVVRFSLLEFD